MSDGNVSEKSASKPLHWLTNDDSVINDDKIEKLEKEKEKESGDDENGEGEDVDENEEDDEMMSKKAVHLSKKEGKFVRIPVSSKTIYRWTTLVEILGSFGGKCSPSKFRVPLLRSALEGGMNTYTFISSTTGKLNLIYAHLSVLFRFVGALDRWGFFGKGGASPIPAEGERVRKIVCFSQKTNQK